MKKSKRVTKTGNNMSSEGTTDEKGNKVDYMTEFGLFVGSYKQFPNKTILTTPSQNLSYNVKKSLDKVVEKNSKKSVGGCWGKSKK